MNTQGINVSAPTFTTLEDRVGTCQLRVVAHFSTGQPNGAYDVTATFSVTVLPPDTVTLANGAKVLNQNLAIVPSGPNPQPNVQVIFNIQYGSRILNCGGTAIENVKRSSYTDALLSTAPDTEWTDPVPYLSCTLGAVTDGKGIVDSPLYQGWQPNTIVEHFDQYIGLKVPTACGGTQEIHFPTKFQFKMIKIDGGNWQLILVP
jgi:hypothetical protein